MEKIRTLIDWHIDPETFLCTGRLKTEKLPKITVGILRFYMHHKSNHIENLALNI